MTRFNRDPLLPWYAARDRHDCYSCNNKGIVGQFGQPTDFELVLRQTTSPGLRLLWDSRPPMVEPEESTALGTITKQRLVKTQQTEKT
jgi:hypothetical protein